jgi:predicted AlkP superfamily phosphohydrolase/phosphomutase
LRRALTFTIAACLLINLAPAPASAASPAPAARTQHVLMFVTDGGQPDFFQQFAEEGNLPAFAQLEAEGAMSLGGMSPQLPTSTRVGWPAILTGAWGGTHGSVNNVFTLHGLGMAESFPAGTHVPLQAETLAEAAERAGLNVLMYDWNSSDQPAIEGPTVRYWRTYTRAGVAQNYDEPAVAAGAAAWGLMFDRLTVVPTSGGPGAPASHSPLMGATLRLTEFTGGSYEYGVRFYDSTNDGRVNYDGAAVVGGAGEAADLSVGRWAEVRLKLAGGVDAGRTAGFYLKLMEMAPDLSRVKFFVSAVSRVNAQPAALEDYLADNFPTRTGASGALAWERMIDEDTYAEAAALTIPFNTQALPWLLTEYAPETNLAIVGYLNTDIIQHATLALVTVDSAVYDDADRDGEPDGLVERRLGYLRETYRGADETLAAAWGAMPADTVVVAASDHGFAPTWRAVYAPYVLGQAGLQPDPQTSNCMATDRALAKACWVGGAVMIYMNVRGREPNGVIAPEDYDEVRDQIVTAWRSLRDEDGQAVAAAVYTSDEAATLPSSWGTASMAHPDRTGDVIVFANLPYQFDFAEGGTPLRDTTVWWAAHGHLPSSTEGHANANLNATFYIAGPAIRPGRPTRVRTIDIAPTLAFLLGIPAPAQAEGRVLSEVLAGPACWGADPGEGRKVCSIWKR